MNMNFLKFIALVLAFTGLLLKGSSSAIAGQETAKFEEFKQQQQKKSTEYLEKQEADSKTFLVSLKETGRNEKLLAIKNYKTKQYIENCEFREKMHAAKIDFVKAVMASKPFVPRMMKNKKMAEIKLEYEKLKDFHTQKNKENMEFIDKLIADKSKDGKELDEILQDFMKSQKSDVQQFQEKQKEK